MLIDLCCLLHVACLLSVCHCLFSHYARQYLLKSGGQLDKRMLHWQPAKCCIFQLFIIICYLANKLLLLLLLQDHYDVERNKTVFRNTTPDLQDQDQDRRFWSQTGLVLRPTVSDHITGITKGCGPSVPKNCCDTYVRPNGLTYSDVIWYDNTCGGAAVSRAAARAGPEGWRTRAHEFWDLLYTHTQCTTYNTKFCMVMQVFTRVDHKCRRAICLR